MLELKLKIDSEQEDGSYFTVIDETGVYNASTNVGGYGAPNIERNITGVILLAERVLGTKRYPITVTPNDSQLLADEWQVETKKDGFYALLLVAAVAWETSYTMYADEYRAFNGKLYKCLTLHDSDLESELEDATLWKEITSIADIAIGTAIPEFYYDYQEHLITTHTELCKLNRTIAFAQEGTDAANAEENANKFIHVETQYLAAKYSAAFGDFTEAGKFIEEAFNSCSSNSNCGC